ncbi:MAG: hypothetical protein JNM24_08695 [Bdellovibrionaceae bacterium]|nr:hypothetical protein [Pseudobdellovibrionaceae bacterium]
MKRERNLITIDQRPLRANAINELEKWHDKIELLEIEIQKFHDTDFKLYNDWLRLTLADLQEENNTLIDKYQKIALFHNWVVFTADEKNISLPHAFFLMSEEELKYQKGSPEEREQIEKLREVRTKKIHAELKSDSEDDFDNEEDFQSDSEQYNDENFDADRERNSWIEQEEREIRLQRERFQKEILFFESLTDKKIVKKMRDFGEGISLISTCVYVCSLCYRFDLVERIWAFVPLKIKTHFNSDFKKQMGVTLDQYLMNVKEDAKRTSNDEEFGEEFDFKSHFENPFASKTKTEAVPENLEAAKIVYRRIMMKVHPDKLSADFVNTKKHWLDRLWKKIQSAYDQTDVKALKNLHLQVLVTLKNYDDLDLSDLRAGTQLLQAELTRLGKSHEDTLQHPAWGFSKLKSYKKLEKIVAEPYKKTSKELKKDIKRIEGTHTALQDFVNSVQAAGGFGRTRRRKPTQRRKKQPKTNEHQTALF